MAMEICIGILSNFFQKLLIVNSANKFNSLIALEMKFSLQLIQELLIHICNNGKILFALTLHELPNHNFKRVLRYKTTDDKVVFLFRQPHFFIPVHQFLISVSQLTEGQICTIRNKCGLRISALDAFSVIALMDILLDIH